MRVPNYLSDQAVAFEQVVHAPAFTSQRLAKSLRVKGRTVLKSVLLKGPKGDFLAVLPAPLVIDLPRLSTAMGGPVRLATSEEIRARFLDCEVGAMMPFGHIYGLTTLLEVSVALDATIVFEAQRHAVAIRMSCRDYVKLERPERIAFACKPSAEC
jgi:Ala-tRNA(Pro) deacylase